MYIPQRLEEIEKEQALLSDRMSAFNAKIKDNKEIMQVALLPVAYTKGTDFKRASRPPVDAITHWNSW